MLQTERFLRAMVPRLNPNSSRKRSHSNETFRNPSPIDSAGRMTGRGATSGWPGELILRIWDSRFEIREVEGGGSTGLAQSEALRVLRPIPIYLSYCFCSSSPSASARPPSSKPPRPALLRKPLPVPGKGSYTTRRETPCPGRRSNCGTPCSGGTLTTTTDAQGAFRFPEVPAGSYAVRVRWHDTASASRELLRIRPGSNLNSTLQLAAAGGELTLETVSCGCSSRRPAAAKISPAGKSRSCP